MSGCDGKCNKIYLDCTSEKSKPTYLVNVNELSSEKCKCLNNFATRYAETRNFKEGRHESHIDNIFCDIKKVMLWNSMQ